MLRSIPSRTVLLALGAATASLAWLPGKLYDFPEMPLIGESGRADTAWYFDSLRNADSVYARLPLPVREGGWSGLEPDTTDATGHTFWTINDRGLNVAHELNGRADKVFPFPGYHHKLLKVRVDGDSVRILSMDSIRSLEDASVFTTGLVSTKASTGETALRMRLDSAIVDTSATNRLAAVPYGYDFESIRRRGNSLWMSDEYGPFVVEVDLSTMRLKREWYPGNGLPEVLKKRRANRGMESMALTPSGKVVGLLQSPMYNQAGANSNDTRDAELIRLVWLDPATGATREYAYLPDLKDGNRRGRDVKTSDMVALSETRFLVLEQGVENKGDKRYLIDIFEIDLGEATDISAPGPDGLLLGGKTLETIAKTPGALAKAGIVPVAKRLLVGDLLRTTAWVSEKPEGLAIIDDSTLVLSNDNDYGMTDKGGDGIPHILPASQRKPSILYFRVPSLAARLTDSGFARSAAFRLTVLHNNDGESQLLYAGTNSADRGRGGIHRFKALVDSARRQAASAGREVLVLTAGDNFLAGKEWQASMDRDTTSPIYDAMALDRVGYDALVLGNHDFDFGPDVLARFIRSFSRSKAPFLSANLSFRNEPAMMALVDSGRVRSHLVVNKGGQRIGIVGATTPTITTISSPRNTTIDTAIVAAIQSRVDSLVKDGIDKIVVVSHLQAVANDTVLATKLRHVDIMLAGGGDELLAGGMSVLQPGQVAAGTYPLAVKDADGRTVYVVTAPGDYEYLGQLEADFDSRGEVIRIRHTSGPRRVVGASFPDGVGEDADVKSEVVDPVDAYVATLAATVVGTTQQGLDGVRNNVRSRQTNLGALTADAMLWQAARMATAYGVDTARISLQNGGGIRNGDTLLAGSLSMADIFDVHPFGNMFAVFPALPVTSLKDAFENAYRLLPASSGAYAQIGGAQVWIDTTRRAAGVDASGAMTSHGERVRTIVMGAADTLVKNGIVLDSARTVPFATIDFLARGGDGFPLSSHRFVVSAVPQHQFLRDYIAQGLGGTVDSTRYPLAFSGRLHIVAPSGPVGAAASPTRSFALRRTPGSIEGRLLLTEPGFVSIELFDIQGRVTARVGGTVLPAGAHTLVIPTRSNGRGVHILRLRAPDLDRVQTVNLGD